MLCPALYALALAVPHLYVPNYKFLNTIASICNFHMIYETAGFVVFKSGNDIQFR